MIQALFFGGAFNPPTRAHIELGHYACMHTGRQKVVYMPSKMSYIRFDQQKNFAFSDQTRIAMLQKIAENRDWMLVSDHEINSEKQPRTYDSLCWLKQQGYQCSLLFGSDKLPELKTGWLHVEEIAKEFGIVCMSRNDEDVNQIIASDPYLSSLQAWITILPVPEEYQTISSTRVRKLFLEKKYEEIEKYVPAELNGLREYD